jgi:hypothetical protein
MIQNGDLDVMGNHLVEKEGYVITPAQDMEIF